MIRSVVSSGGVEILGAFHRSVATFGVLSISTYLVDGSTACTGFASGRNGAGFVLSGARSFGRDKLLGSSDCARLTPRTT
jgi:hypothetical protein